MKGADIGANVIRGLKIKKSSSSVENSDDCDDSGIDALSEVEDDATKKRKKSLEVAKEYVELKDKRDLLPTEVCF